MSFFLPWSPTPPTSSSSSPYFDSNFNPLVGGNGFTPSQQTPPSQVGAVNPSPSGGVHPSMLSTFANNGKCKSSVITAQEATKSIVFVVSVVGCCFFWGGGGGGGTHVAVSK